MDTFIHLTSSHGKLEVTCLLLDNAAYVGAKDQNRRTLFHLVSSPEAEIVRLLLDRGAGTHKFSGQE